MATVRIESESRWDALALAGKLSRYHWFLVEPDRTHWDVYVSVEDGQSDNLPADLCERLREWLNERQLESATIHTQAADVVLTRRTHNLLSGAS